MGKLLNSVTKTWRTNYVTTDLQDAHDIEQFVKRPFFLLVGVDGPLMTRFGREKTKSVPQSLRHLRLLTVRTFHCRAQARDQSLDLETFIADHDTLMQHLPLLLCESDARPQLQYSDSDMVDIPPSISPKASTSTRTTSAGLKNALAYAQLQVMNNFATVPELEAHLDTLNLTDGERLRPGWDTYFMVSRWKVHWTSLTTTTDTGVARILAVKLHETSRGGPFSPLETDPLDGI